MENIYVAAEREAREETGLICKFVSIIGFCEKFPYRFANTSDIYFLCLLKLEDENQEIKKCEKEIDKIEWMDLNDFLNLESQSYVFGEKTFQQTVLNEANLLIENWDNVDTIAYMNNNYNNMKSIGVRPQISDDPKFRDNQVKYVMYSIRN